MDKIVTKIKSKKLHYVLKALKHFGDEEYMDFFWKEKRIPYCWNLVETVEETLISHFILFMKMEMAGDFLQNLGRCWQNWYLPKGLV